MTERRAKERAIPTIDRPTQVGLVNALKEILEVASTSTILDRHGNRHQACDTTCLNDVKVVARVALKELEHGETAERKEG